MPSQHTWGCILSELLGETKTSTGASVLFWQTLCSCPMLVSFPGSNRKRSKSHPDPLNSPSCKGLDNKTGPGTRLSVQNILGFTPSLHVLDGVSVYYKLVNCPIDLQTIFKMIIFSRNKTIWKIQGGGEERWKERPLC